MRSKAAGARLRICRRKLQQILHVGALLIEVQRVEPLLDAARGLGLRRDALHAHDAVHILAEIISVQPDLQVRQAVVPDPLGQRLREPIAHRVGHIRVCEGSGRSDQMVSGMRGLGRRLI